ncbi:MAG: 4Fe-4S dicluster domain-containing protein [Bauldia sp.]
MNFAAVDGTLERLFEVKVPAAVTSVRERPLIVPSSAPDFVRRVTAPMLAARGDDIPVSRIPADGTFPSGTSAYEKRNIADSVPAWEEDLCIQCGQCSFVCPHSVIRSRTYHEDRLAGAPDTFKSAPVNARGYPEARFTLQFYVEDCTGCALCVEACPAVSPREPGVKAINMADKEPLLAGERANLAFFEKLPVNDRARVDFANVRGVQFLEPLFEFSGACAGCGETPYLKLLSQLFGDRAQIANATGCSSIYGGSQPVTPWTKDREGRGPAWSNSLFEDNAEFGLGFRLAADKHLELAQSMLRGARPRRRRGACRGRPRRAAGPRIGNPRPAHPRGRAEDAPHQAGQRAGPRPPLGRRSFRPPQRLDRGRRRLGLRYRLRRPRPRAGRRPQRQHPGARHRGLFQHRRPGRRRRRRWAPPPSSPPPASAPPRKDLALQAIAYGNVYVAQVAMGANPQQTLDAFREAEAYEGTSLILAYSQCIAHGIDMRFGMKQQDLAVASGYWPLLRFNPAMRSIGENPFRLDSPRPTIPFKDYAYNEIRYSSLAELRPGEAAGLLVSAQAAVTEKYRQYEDLAGLDGSRFLPGVARLAETTTT